MESDAFALEPALHRFTFGNQRWWLHVGLFLLTFLTTTFEGVAWRGRSPFELENFAFGLEYSLLLLLFLSSHEFGHFIASRLHGVEATLPYYIPLPGSLVGMTPSFGTLGAIIRTRTKVPSKRAMFDIGVAGPLAGFVVCIALLAIGFATLPGIEYLRAIHPNYPNEPTGAGFIELTLGKTILYSLFEKLFARPGGFVPPMTEMYHYPLLCVGWFGTFVTSLNLLPVGQLDGGHITYCMFPKSVHRRLGQFTVAVLLALALPETALDLMQAGAIHVPQWLERVVVPGGSTWLVWALIILFVIRFRHPETLDERPLDTKRMLLGALALVIFVLSFTPSPLTLSSN